MEEVTPSRHPRNPHLVLHKVATEMASEGALEVVVEGSGVAFVAIEGDSVIEADSAIGADLEIEVGSAAEAVSATRVEVVSVDAEATRAGLPQPTLRVALVAEVVLVAAAEVADTMIEEMGTEDEGLLAATTTLSAIVIEATRTATGTETRAATKTETDMEVEDAMTTTTPESDNTTTMGMMIPDSAEGIEQPSFLTSFLCATSNSTSGGLVGIPFTVPKLQGLPTCILFPVLGGLVRSH